jgi:hypothetical protein
MREGGVCRQAVAAVLAVQLPHPQACNLAVAGLLWCWRRQ